MAAGWKRFTGSSQYPELTSNKDGSAFTYGTKQNRGFRMTWIQGKRNEQDERDILDWISKVCGENIPRDRENALEALYDGKILCR
uniref:Calponin-homology (CH) domain-containing protein n=1 Tax=Heterorhabditis bacteriophora TaxID=37862 RepID=A0A1I7X0K6_HETBA